jgi:hypothetical protein
MTAGLPEWTTATFLGLSNVSRTPRWLLAPRIGGVQRRLKWRPLYRVIIIQKCRYITALIFQLEHIHTVFVNKHYITQFALTDKSLA